MRHAAVWVVLGVSLMASQAGARSIPPVATDELAAIRDLSVRPPRRARTSRAQQDANKLIVMRWHYEFFDLGHFRSASEKYLAPEFKPDDPREPAGREAYVRAFETNAAYHPPPPDRRPPKVAVFAQDDLVMMVIPTRGKDGQWNYADIHCNMFRLVDGRIAELWVAGN